MTGLDGAMTKSSANGLYVLGSHLGTPDIPLEDIGGHILCPRRTSQITGHDGAVAMSSANGLVGTGFASRYRLRPRAGFLNAQWVGVRPLRPLLSQGYYYLLTYCPRQIVRAMTGLCAHDRRVL